ncbi:MAG: hypothetical protein GWP74_04315, partial [Proteobacteria bacterium]|nr:hypothetical protein [Pseudomonadota bacterium]
MRASGWILLLAGATVAVADLEMRQPLVTSAPGLSAIQPVSAVSERPVRYGAVAEVVRVAARLEKYGGLQEMPEVGGAIAGLGPAGGISPMSFWRFHALRRPEDSAAWDNELRDLDVPNAFEQPAFPGAKDLKLVAVADWSMPPPSDTNAVRMLQERVLAEKAHGYNGVALGYRTDLGAERVLDMLSWARSHFDTVLLTVVVRPPYAGPADIKSELDALLGSGNVDAVVSGYGSTIDVMGAFVANPHYRDTHRGRSTQYFTRWVD